MRKGENLKKDVLLEDAENFHRVIIPLYIPHENDYYKDAFDIFDMSLRSLHKTSVNALVVSVICNACASNVTTKVFALHKEGKIDELIIVNEAIGKVNAILKALRTARERLITVTDADVLFLNGWELAVLDVFKAFPKAGVVSPVPLFGNQKRLTFNIWFDYFFSKKIRFKKVKEPEGMTRFVNSIGWPWLAEKYKDVILTIMSKNGITAVVGCGHMAATYKSEVFNSMPKANTQYQLGGNSEQLYLDFPVVKHDGYRLATYGNYAYHMGNTLEDWMKEAYAGLHEETKSNDSPQLTHLPRKNLNYLIKQKLFAKLFKVKVSQKLFYRFKGLKKDKLTYFFKD
jgi:hypothetical protein